jgi:probable phosphoglycerate mutase
MPITTGTEGSILLIRHGETALNVARILQPADTPLSERGIAQADALARRLAPMNIRAIVSSDLPRALRTAQAIAATTAAPIETTPLLQERNFGDWRGLGYDDLPANPLTMVGSPPGGESTLVFEQRVAEAFAHLLVRQSMQGGTIAVVTHGLVIGAMLNAHVRLAAGMQRPGHLGNTSLSVIDATAPHAVSLLNCTRHLDSTTSDDARALSGG